MRLLTTVWYNGAAMNLPNQLTVARFLMALVFVALMSVPSVVCHFLAYLLFIAATITDFYDGKIARDRNLITNFGKLLDPVADKVLVVAAFIMLMENEYLRVPGWTVVVILAREFLVTGARSLAASDGVVIAANKWGKKKAVYQMVYVFTFLFLAIVAHVLDTFGGVAVRFPSAVSLAKALIRDASFWAIVLVAAYTVYSGVQFARVNWRALNIGNV